MLWLSRLKKGIKCGWMCTAPLQQLSAPLELARWPRSVLFYDNGSYNVLIMRNRNKFYYTFNYFQLVTIIYKFGFANYTLKIFNGV